MTAPTLRAISAAQRPAGAADGGRDGGEIAFGRGQKVEALAGALAGEIAIAADDQPLARIVGRRNGRHVTRIEQRHLQGPAFGERPDGRRAQRRDPIETGRRDLGVEARLRDHPAVADQHHMRESEARLDLCDLRGERARVGGIALEYFDRHRAAIRGAQQAVDDLQLALLAVAVIAEPGKLAVAPLQVARRHVVEHQRAVAQMLAGERLLDRRLALAEPIDGSIEFILIDRSKPENVAEAGCRGGRIEHAGGGELGGRRNQAGHDHGDDEIAGAVTGGTENAIKADVAQRAEHRGDMAVWQGAAHDDALLVGRCSGAALEQRAQSLDELAWPIREVRNGALLDPRAVPIALAQQDGGRGIPVRD
jgi:hypothetical protein